MIIELIVFKRGLSGIWVNFFHFLISVFLERKQLSRHFTVCWNNRRLIGGCLYSLVLARGLFLKRFPPLIDTRDSTGAHTLSSLEREIDQIWIFIHLYLKSKMAIRQNTDLKTKRWKQQSNHVPLSYGILGLI